MLDSLPGRQEHYPRVDRAPSEAQSDRRRRQDDRGLQYSPDNNIPYVGLVDAGTVELIRSFGPVVATSADLVQQFEATFRHGGAGQPRLGRREGATGIKDEAFASMGKALRDGARSPSTNSKSRSFDGSKEKD